MHVELGVSQVPDTVNSLDIEKTVTTLTVCTVQSQVVGMQPSHVGPPQLAHKHSCGHAADHMKGLADFISLTSIQVSMQPSQRPAFRPGSIFRKQIAEHPVKYQLSVVTVSGSFRSAPNLTHYLIHLPAAVARI